ncbi:MAG: ATP-binding cassette domain-containing protein, partial [Rikenellaceae bacterium]
MDNEILIELEDVTIYAVDNNERRYYKNNIILSKVNLQIFAGEMVYLIGKVGSGKSSLLKTLYAELPLVSGWGRVGDFDLSTLKDKEIPNLRRSLGLVFQDFQLLPDRSVYENLRFFLRSIGWKNIAAINERIAETLSLVSLRDKAQKLPYELSGGEQQRLAIGRAILNRPKIILADEPTGNLDPMCTTDIMQLFSDISSMGCAVVIATHNLSIIEQFPSRTMLLNEQNISDID